MKARNIDKLIQDSLAKNLRFYPEVGSEQFASLSPEEQQKALDYFSKDQERIRSIVSKIKIEKRGTEAGDAQREAFRMRYGVDLKNV